VLAIGVQLGGPEQKGSLISTMLTRAMQTAANERHLHYDDGVEPWINPIFIVPGSISKPDFVGFKLGHFNKQRKGLVVMIETPQLVADGEAITEFVVASLQHVIALAAERFAKAHILISKDEAARIITRIEAALRAVAMETRH